MLHSELDEAKISREASQRCNLSRCSQLDCAHVVGDNGGSFEMANSATHVERCVCLCTFLLSRAIHIEMAFAIDSTSFLNALSQMINRRGCPIEVISGNGGNFVSTGHLRREFVDEFDSKARKSLSMQPIS